ncbi:MAG: biopolymer transporter ExbD [bacterium]|nr:biopolymer transporter ExbD [bacterium]
MRNQASSVAVIIVAVVVLFLMLGGLVVVAGGVFYLRSQTIAIQQSAQLEELAAAQARAHAESNQAKAIASLAEMDEHVANSPFAETSEIQVNVSPNGQLTLNEKAIELDELQNRLVAHAENTKMNIAVKIVADGDTPFQFVAELLSVCEEMQNVDATVQINPEPKPENETRSSRSNRIITDGNSHMIAKSLQSRPAL